MFLCWDREEHRHEGRKHKDTDNKRANDIIVFRLSNGTHHIVKSQQHVRANLTQFYFRFRKTDALNDALSSWSSRARLRKAETGKEEESGELRARARMRGKRARVKREKGNVERKEEKTVEGRKEERKPKNGRKEERKKRLFK